MADSNKTPIWLQLRKEYIDDNFTSLIPYLQEKSASQDKDDFYKTTLELLKQRVDDLINELAVKPLFSDKNDRKQTIFNINLLAILLLVEPNTQLGISAYIAMMNELRTLHPNLSDKIIAASMNRLKHENVTALGFTWGDLSKIGTELFAHNACTNARYDSLLKKPLFLPNYGTAILTSDGIFLTHEVRTEAKKLIGSGANSLDTGIGVTLRSKSSEKLKQSLENDMVGMDEYTKDFVIEQYKAQNKKETKLLKNFEEGDEVYIKITKIDYKGTVHVETIDPGYNKLDGVLKWEHYSLIYYYTDTLYEYFEVGDLFKATITDSNKPTFSLDAQFVRFLVEDTKAYQAERGDVFLCKLIDDKSKRQGWINSYGVAFYADSNPTYKKGDFALLEITNYGKGASYGAINAKIYGDTSDSFDERTIRKECIRAFAEDTEEPVFKKEEEVLEELSPNVLRLLLRQLFEHQKTQLNPADRFRLQANAIVMAELIGDELAASFIRFESSYLRALVQFANNQDISDVKIIPDSAFSKATSTLLRLSVIDILKEYGKKENSEILARTISDFEDGIPVLARLARLVQTANSMQGTLSDAAINVIRREIIKTLSLETENDADLEADSGTYLGIESGTVEFKTSMVFPPDKDKHMQADESLQNHNVLKGICAFLNSMLGGTLYLGVNDQGYITGIEADMKHLRIQTIDSYLRYVQDIIKAYLGVDSLTYIRIEPLYENRVVAIHVDPHPYRLVELSNKAYLRVNAESREMPEKVREEIIARKVFKDKNRAAAISMLQHACSGRKCVILHNYSSSNSGTIKERKVEPYDVRPEDGLFFALDYKDFTSKVFNINRIGYVEVLNEESWRYPSSHKKDILVDVFHMSGTEPTHISLQLDLMAKNLLIEEFPASKDFVKPHKGDDNIWYFDTNVYSMEGIGRFFIGLAKHIKILEGEKLKAFVKDYVSSLSF